MRFFDKSLVHVSFRLPLMVANLFHSKSRHNCQELCQLFPGSGGCKKRGRMSNSSHLVVMKSMILTSSWSPPCDSLTTTLRECGNGIFIFEARCSDFVNLMSRRMTSGCCENQTLTENLFKLWLSVDSPSACSSKVDLAAWKCFWLEAEIQFVVPARKDTVCSHTKVSKNPQGVNIQLVTTKFNEKR